MFIYGNILFFIWTVVVLFLQALLQEDISQNRKKNLADLNQQTEAEKKKEKEIVFAEHRLALIETENQKYVITNKFHVDAY